MVTIDNNIEESLEWVRFVLDPTRSLPKVENWQNVYKFACRQCIAGVCNPTNYNVHVPVDTLLDWMDLVIQLRKLNAQINQEAANLFGLLKEDGFRCCILKGQGNASMYPESDLRWPGDIDVWVDADKEALYGYVKKRFPDINESVKHIKFPIFPDTEVDVHYSPLKFYHPVHNRRLQQWIVANKEQQFGHYVRLANTDTDIAVPTPAFNAVYQLGHIMIHLGDEGIGFRQMIDYYYVLKLVGEVTAEEHQAIKDAWKSLGMMRLASAVMWFEHHLLGLPDEYLLIEPNEKRGKIIARDILEGGNFGKFSKKQKLKTFGRIGKGGMGILRLIELFSCFPGEAIFRCLGKIRTAFKVLKRQFT